MNIDAVTPLRLRMVEDMMPASSVRKRRGATFTAASGSLSFSNGHLTRRQQRTSAGFSCIFPRRA